MDYPKQEAEHFVNCEREFQLGMLPTEQSHPKTKGLAEMIARDTRKGIAMLQSVDEEIVAAARRSFASKEFLELTDAMVRALSGGGRIVFSGCGATGRLSILLEAAYRTFWHDARRMMGDVMFKPELQRAENAVASIMTGGDYALVRSVEFFEDNPNFGRHQVIEARVGKGDVLVAISEGGETSSVIGTVWEALESGAQVFFACNNPLALLAAHVERTRRVIDEPRITKLDLSSGPMAILGSTRMQATSTELLVIGAALEIALARHLNATLPPHLCAKFGVLESLKVDHAAVCEVLLQELSAAAAVEAMARWVEMEEGLYRGENAITYFGNDYLLDIFTDTTERAPTFSLPPFRKGDDRQSPRPYSFVKHPGLSVAEAWRRMLGRQPCCLNWNSATYQRLGAAESIWQSPPALNQTELFKFLIGSEDDPSRYSGPHDCAALVLIGAEACGFCTGTPLGDAFSTAAARFPSRALLSVGSVAPPTALFSRVSHVTCKLTPSLIRLWEHIAIKLVLNTISTATGARLGYVVSNWMAYVETTNKKLIDRGTRIVAEFTGLNYAEACYELHKSRASLVLNPFVGGKRLSPVAVTVERLRQQGVAGDKRAI